MAAFCSTCGAPLTAGAKFCEKCGTPVVGPPVAPGTPLTPSSSLPMSGPAPSQSSSTGTKIIIAILAVIMFIILLVAGSCFYIGYRIKKRAHEFSREMNNVPAYTGRREPCALLTADEASTALGQTVASAEPRGTSSCIYTYGSDNSKQVEIRYDWRGGAMAMKMTVGAMKQISGLAAFTSIDGVGDEAYLAPMGSSLIMRKGDVMVNMELGTSGMSPDAAKKMAKIIAGRLQ